MADSFLHDLYVHGELRRSVLEEFRCEELLPEAQAAVVAFEALAEQYPAAENEAAGALPPAARAEMGAQGLFGMTVPAEFGGMGLPFSQYLKIVARIAPTDLSLALVSLAHLSIGLQGIVLYGTPDQKRRYLVPGAAGEMVFAYALTEPQIGSDAQHIQTHANPSRDGSHYLLDGQKTYITNANYADAFTVFAQLEGQRPGTMAAFIVERDAEGLTVGRDMPKMGLKASSTAAVGFDRVVVPRENLLGQPGDGFRIAMSILNYGRLAVAAAGVGLMEQAVRDIRSRAEARIQFGVPIASFELIREKAAKARLNAFVAAHMVEFAARQLERSPLANVAVETSHCKLFCTTRAWDALYDAQQVAGGSGYLAVSAHERRLRDWRVATVFEGTTEIHSMYPALFLLRAIGERLPRWLPARGWALLQGGLRRPPWPPSPADRVLRRCLASARRMGRQFALLLRVCLLRYGKGVVTRQFLLRRLTWLSLYAFGLLAAAAGVEAERKAGRPVDEALLLLAAFREEAVRHARRSWWTGYRTGESFLRRIAARIFS
jgi:acyl-CoA dehydrogenase family protein 9